MTEAGTAKEYASAWPIYRRLLGYTRQYWLIGVVAVFAMIVDAACMGVFARLIKYLVDDLFVRRDPQMIFWMPILIIVIFVLRGIATFITDYGTAHVGSGVVQRLRQQVFEHYLRLPASALAKEAPGQRIARISYTAEQVAKASTDAVKVTVVDGLSVIFYVLVMLLASARLTLALILLVPLIGAVVVYVSRRYRRINQRLQGSMGSITGMVEEVIDAQREVKVYGGQDYECKRFAGESTQTRRFNVKIAATNGASTSLVQIVAALALALIVFLATRPAVLDSLTAGDFTSLILAMGGLLPSLKRLTTVQASLQRGVTAAEDMFAVLDTPVETDSGRVSITRCRGAIRFDGVSMRYQSDRARALDGIELECAAGSVTALVGRSGSGKSSLVSLLPRFHEPDAGEVLLDGRPLREYTLDSLRRQIAWVGQRVTLFDDTLARNIAYGELEHASEEDIVAAARAANAMEFIEQLPLGIHQPLGSGGANLSGGQRQRVAIARAILKNAPILILDEATSALDSESERLIQDALARLMRDRTTLVIAHRLSTVEHADQIVVLEQGKIAERGTHAELLAASGRYKRLYDMQFHAGAN